MENYAAKIVKYGIVFFGDMGVIKFDANSLEIARSDGSVAFSSPYANLKSASFNSNNGMWTLKSLDGQKCNMVVKDSAGSEKLGAYLDAAHVKGFAV